MTARFRQELPKTCGAQVEAPSELPPWQRPTMTKMALAMTLSDFGSGVDGGGKTSLSPS